MPRLLYALELLLSCSSSFKWRSALLSSDSFSALLGIVSGISRKLVTIDLDLILSGFASELSVS